MFRVATYTPFLFLIFFLHISSVAFAALTESGEYLPKKFLSNKIQTLYNTSNSLIDNEANDITQTKEGYIWIAAYSGLIRFDGNRFTLISEKNSPLFTSQSCRSLLAAQSGALYIGTNDKGLFALEKGVMRKITTGEGLANLIRAVLESNGKVYALTATGLGVVQGDQLVKIPLALENSYFLEGAIDRDGNIYAVNNIGELFHIQPATAKYHKISLSDKRVLAVAADHGKETLYFALEKEKLLIQRPDSTKIVETPGIGTANSLYLDTVGRIWIPGQNGIGFVDTGDQFHLLKIDEIDSDFERVWQDYEGNHWIASGAGGVVKINDSKFCDIFYDNQLAKSLVYTTAVIDNTLYIGTRKGLKVVRPNGLENSQAVKMTKGFRIRSLFVDSGKNLWICTYGLGVLKIKGNEILGHWTEKTGLPINKTRAITEADDGTFYIATTAGIAVLQNGRIDRVIGKRDGLKSDFILNLTTHGTTLIAGSDGGGVYTIQPHGMTTLTQRENDLKSDVILRTLYHEETAALFLSSGTLQIQLPDKTIKSLNRQQIEGDIFDIKIYRNKVVLITSKGLCIGTVQEILTSSTPRFQKLSKSDGLPSIPTANSWSALTANGDLYIATMEGVRYINLDKIPFNTTAPKIALNAIQVDSKEISPSHSIELDAENQTIAFKLAVLSFGAAQNNRVQFQLEGFDSLPKAGTILENDSIIYTNLDGGKYTFRFRGINADGIVSKEQIKVQVNKAPSLLERPVTYLFMAFALIGLTFLIVNRIYRKKKQTLIQERNTYREITAEAIEVISHTIDAKDAYTRGHSQRVADYSVILGRRIGFDEKKLEELYYIALVHDIGKISIPDAILNKTGKLSPEEYEMMRSHARKGYEILKNFNQLDMLWVGAFYHHERWDGKGYPNAIGGEEIPLYGRIIAVADSYDAMASDRPYRKGLSAEKILDELEKGRGKQFDTRLVHIMIELIDEGVIAEAGAKTPY